MAVGVGGGGGNTRAVLEAMRGLGLHYILYADSDSITLTKLLLSGLTGPGIGFQVLNPVSGTSFLVRGSTSGSLNRQSVSRGPAEVATLAGRIVELWCNSNNGVTGGINSLAFRGHGTGASDGLGLRIRTDLSVLGAADGQGNFTSTFPIVSIRSIAYVPTATNGGFRYAAIGFGREPGNVLASTDPPVCAGFIARSPTGNWNFLVAQVEGGLVSLDEDSGFSVAAARLLEVRYRQPTVTRPGQIEFLIDGILRRIFSGGSLNFRASPVCIIRSDGSGGGTGTGRDGGTVTSPAAVHFAYVEVADAQV